MALSTQFPPPTGVAQTTMQTRRARKGEFETDTSGVTREGLLPHTTGALVTSLASMGVSVAAFNAVLVRNGVPAVIGNDGATTVSGFTAPGSNSKYVIIYVKQNENSSPFADGDNLPVFGHVSGTAAASPDLAAAIALVPAEGLPLAAILLPSTATTTQSGGVTITQIAPFTAMTGGVVLLRSQAEQDAWTPRDGSLARRIDTNTLIERTSGVWGPIGGDTGWILCSPESAFYNVVTVGNDRALSHRRIGKTVHLAGHISTDGGTATYSIWAYVAAGSRPAKNEWLLAVPDGAGTSLLRCFIADTGAITFAASVAGVQSVLVSGTWFIE